MLVLVIGHVVFGDPILAANGPSQEPSGAGGAKLLSSLPATDRDLARPQPRPTGSIAPEHDRQAKWASRDPSPRKSSEPSPAVGSPARPPAPASASDLEEQALREEQLEAARELQRRHPTDDALFILGAVFNEQGNLEEAIRYWREGLGLPPSKVRLHDRANVLANLGEALRLREDDEGAEAALREALRLNPRREETRFRLAQLLCTRNRSDECLQVLDASRESSARVLSLRGQACQRLDRLAEARHHFEAALEIDPDSSEACYGLLAVCLRLGDDASATEYQRRFAALKARQQSSGRSLREQFSPLHITRQSLAVTHTAIGWVYAESGEPTRAEATWRRAAELDPSNTACRFHLLMLLQKTGRNSDALLVCEEMIRLEPTNAFHQLSLGNLQVRLGATNRAAAAFSTAHDLAPQRPETCFALAQFYLRNNTNLLEAAALAQHAVNLSPVAPHYYVLSRLRAKTSDRDAALTAAARATELDPNNRDYREWRATLEMTR